jgi:hypothetical protein
MNQPTLFAMDDFSGAGPIDTARPMGARRPSGAPKATPANHARVLLRCSKKGCKFCKAADIPQVREPNGYGGTYAAFDRHALAKFKTDTKCPAHPNAYLESQTVEGTFSASHKCDPRCTSAIGKVCVCSCGGANHGCGWL